MYFVSVVNSTGEEIQAKFMVESLRSFGGGLSDSPVLIFNPMGVALENISKLKNVDILPLEIEEPVRHYDLADKVFACAKAEEMLGNESGSLAWINLDCLFVNPPVLFQLGSSFDAALRPVHLRNVGSPAEEPLDDYWRVVYNCIGLETANYSVESFVDAQIIRPYFNTHCFSINPARGIMQAWRQYFKTLVSDRDFQAGPCRDELHHVFLHQVVLSVLILKLIEPERIRFLPPEYSYPLHLQGQIPASHQFQSLNSTVCTVYEDASSMTGIEVLEPLKSWLTAHH